MTLRNSAVLLQSFLVFSFLTVAFSALAQRGALTRLKDSPYKNFKISDYERIGAELKLYFGANSTGGYAPVLDVPFLDSTSRLLRIRSLTKEHPTRIELLPIMSDDSSRELEKLALTGDRKAMTHLKIYAADAVKNKTSGPLFGFRVFKDTSHGKANILIWAKEHADEYSTSEFAQQLTEFFIAQLDEPANSSALASAIHRIFDQANLVVLPDMTPSKNAKNNSTEDRTNLSIFLQPFDFDAETPFQRAIAPEAVFFRDVVASLNDVILGIDLHDPYGMATSTLQSPVWANKTDYIIAEGFRANCESKTLGDCKPADEFNVQSGISTSTKDAASYLSRIKNAPTIFFELGGQMGSLVRIPPTLDTGECNRSAKDKSCFYFVRNSDLAHEIPFFLRVMEIAIHEHTKIL